MLHDVLNRLHLVDVDGVLLPADEVANEYRRLLLIDEFRELLEFLVVACAGSQLQCGNGFRVPCMFDSILPPVELTEVG